MDKPLIETKLSSSEKYTSIYLKTIKYTIYIHGIFNRHLYYTTYSIHFTRAQLSTQQYQDYHEEDNKF